MLSTLAIRDGTLERTGRVPHQAVSSFSDATPARWQNPKLKFGGVSVPDVGFGFRLVKPKAEAPADAEVKVYFEWQ